MTNALDLSQSVLISDHLERIFLKLFIQCKLKLLTTQCVRQSTCFEGCTHFTFRVVKDAGSNPSLDPNVFVFFLHTFVFYCKNGKKVLISPPTHTKHTIKNVAGIFSIYSFILLTLVPVSSRKI